jgi:hypothetical protein
MRYLPSGDGGSDVLKLLAAVAGPPELLDTARCASRIGALSSPVRPREREPKRKRPPFGGLSNVFID